MKVRARGLVIREVMKGLMMESPGGLMMAPLMQYHDPLPSMVVGVLVGSGHRSEGQLYLHHPLTLCE